MDLRSQAITYLAYASAGLFAVGVGIMSYVTYRVANWMQEAEYNQMIDDDIAKKDVKQKLDRKDMEGTIKAIEHLKSSIKDKEEDLGKQPTTKETPTNVVHVKKEKEDSDSEKSAEDKHTDDIKAVLNLKSY